MNHRLKFPCYRCYECGRLLTRYQIYRAWESAEAAGHTSSSICSCGSRRITPTNPSLKEELTTPAIWYLWIRDYSPIRGFWG